MWGDNVPMILNRVVGNVRKKTDTETQQRATTITICFIYTYEFPVNFDFPCLCCPIQ